MFYTALILSHHCSNDGNNKKFITIDICSNYVFLLILVRRSLVTPTTPRSNWVPVTQTVSTYWLCTFIRVFQIIENIKILLHNLKLILKIEIHWYFPKYQLFYESVTSIAFKKHVYRTSFKDWVKCTQRATLEIEMLIESLDSGVAYTGSRYRFDRVFKYQKVDQTKDNAQPV